MKKRLLAILIACVIGVTAPQAMAQNVDTPTSPSILDRIKAMFSSISHTPSSQQDIAVQLARQGQYDDALDTLSKLHEKDPADQSVTRDYVAVLSWDGRDQDAINAFETLPSLESQPDYVLAAAGHSYHKLGQYDKALVVYRAGVKKYPDSTLFAEGEIRCMADSGDLDGALAKANQALDKRGSQAAIIATRIDIQKAIVKRDDQKAVELARGKNYPEALGILSDLHTKHADDPAVTRDYLAVLDWAGGQDQQVVDLYKSLPAGDQPDYVLEAVGHAYRNLNQPENAMPVYQQGWKQYPDSVIFAEGTIRCLVDEKKYNDALKMANDDLKAHGDRPEIVDVKKYILKQFPKSKKHIAKKSKRSNNG